MNAPALLLIDLQRAIDDPRWGRRNNPALEANVARLLAAWRERGWPVHHVAHRSSEPGSTYAPDGPGAPFKPEAAPRAGEEVTEKRVHSALVGTDLEARLRAGGGDAWSSPGSSPTTRWRRRCGTRRTSGSR